jgi:hypothetical protein
VIDESLHDVVCGDRFFSKRALATLKDKITSLEEQHWSSAEGASFSVQQQTLLNLQLVHLQKLYIFLLSLYAPEPL